MPRLLSVALIHPNLLSRIIFGDSFAGRFFIKNESAKGRVRPKKHQKTSLKSGSFPQNGMKTIILTNFIRCNSDAILYLHSRQD